MGKRTAVEMVADTFGSTSSTEARGYDAMAVANWFIREAVSDRRPLDLLTLLKLIYLAHGYSTLREGGSKPDSPGLINDKFQAWKYGPVVPRVYKLLRQQGIIIDESLNDEAWGDDSERLSQCSEDVDLLRRVYKKYRDSDAFALSVETHGESSPWKKRWCVARLLVRSVRRTFAHISMIIIDFQICPIWKRILPGKK